MYSRIHNNANSAYQNVKKKNQKFFKHINTSMNTPMKGSKYFKN